MKVSFVSKDEENNKIKFISEVKEINGIFVFADKSVEDTEIHLIRSKNETIFKRVGKTNMLLNFKEGQITKGHYQDSLGLIMDFDVHCLKLVQNKDKLLVIYELILGDLTKIQQEIMLLFY